MSLSRAMYLEILDGGSKNCDLILRGVPVVMLGEQVVHCYLTRSASTVASVKCRSRTSSVGFPRLVFSINTRVALEVIDYDVSKWVEREVIGLQLHVGHPMKIQFRDLRIRRLARQ